MLGGLERSLQALRRVSISELGTSGTLTVIGVGNQVAVAIIRYRNGDIPNTLIVGDVWQVTGLLLDGVVVHTNLIEGNSRERGHTSGIVGGLADLLIATIKQLEGELISLEVSTGQVLVSLNIDRNLSGRVLIGNDRLLSLIIIQHPGMETTLTVIRNINHSGLSCGIVCNTLLSALIL